MRPVWVNPGLRFQTGMRIHSVYMMFYHGRFDVSLTQCKVIEIQNTNINIWPFYRPILIYNRFSSLVSSLFSSQSVELSPWRAYHEYYYIHSTYLTKIYSKQNNLFTSLTFFADTLCFVLMGRHSIVKGFLSRSECFKPVLQTDMNSIPVWVSSRFRNVNRHRYLT